MTAPDPPTLDSDACEQARERVAANPDDPASAQILRDCVRAQIAAISSRPSSGPVPNYPVARALELVGQGRDEAAEILLRKHLSTNPRDVAAMRAMADIAARCGLLEDGQRILDRATEYDPSDAATWESLAKLTYRSAREGGGPAKAEQALAAFDRALELDASREESLTNRAILLMQLRRLQEAEEAFRRLLEFHPDNAQGWVNLGFLLKTVGDFGGSVAAYRTACATSPRMGAAWWGLANLKRARFHDFDIADMLGLIDEGNLPEEQRIDIHFALAAALEQGGDFAGAWDHLQRGNAARMKLHPYDRHRARRAIDAAVKTYTPQFFADRAGQGHPSVEPIFIVSMPRSGSTLLEQVLASHPQVEGTEELVAILQIEGELRRRFRAPTLEAAIVQLPGEELAGFGARYLDLTRFHRRADKPRFTDKKPSNWRQLGLIHCILPQAKVVEIRRNPLDCCLANFKQHFATGLDWSYGLAEVAEEYRQYLTFMNHMDRAAPGLVHRVIYEDLVEDLELQVRGLLEFLDLPFDERCLEFHSSTRPVHTPSAAQVRQPINQEGVGQWRNFAAYIDPLEDALGDAMQKWRG